MSITMECPECYGDGGWVDPDGKGAEQCPTCMGRGQVPYDSKYHGALLIAGSRDVDPKAAWLAIDGAYWELPGIAPAILLSGGARGVDTIGEHWWVETMGDKDSIVRIVPDWDGLGKRAGYVRNVELVERATHAIIVWDGQSRGTAHTLGLVQAKGIPYVLKELH